MSSRRKKRNTLSGAVAVVAALVMAGLYFGHDYLPEFSSEESSDNGVSVASSILEESENPEKHIKAATKALDEIETHQRCTHGEKAVPGICHIDQPYDRTGQFGESWVDVDQDGCNTRDQILNRDLTDIEHRGDTCVVQSGTLEDPYTGKTIDYVKGPKTSRAVQGEHIYPLGAAYDHGAYKWPQGKRVAFANDTHVNLVSADGPANEEKSDQTLGEWTPDTDYKCTYAIKYVWVAKTYDLSMSKQDKKAAKSIFDSCDVVYGEPTDAKPLDKSVWEYASTLPAGEDN